MIRTEASSEGGQALLERQAGIPARPPRAVRHARPTRIVPILLTLGAVLLAGLLGWAGWDTYMLSPWTRDAAVRAYVITETPEVSGKIVNLPVRADQYVHKGDLLFEIDPTDYSIAVSNAEAAAAVAKADLANRQAEASRRERLSTLSTSVEEQQRFAAQAQMADGSYKQALANLSRARVNLQRTRSCRR
jgi:multidrug resistance efflux pump